MPVRHLAIGTMVCSAATEVTDLARPVYSTDYERWHPLPFTIKLFTIYVTVENLLGLELLGIFPRRTGPGGRLRLP